MTSNSSTLQATTLERLSKFIANGLGLYFPSDRWQDLNRGMISVAKSFNFQDTEMCAEWLMTTSLTKKQIEILARYLTVGETFFYRDHQTLESFENKILPAIIHKRRGHDQHIRIWSAGCASGEEPYTIAMILHKYLQDIKDWKITLLATDINPQNLNKLADGVYGQWSFRNTPAWVKDNYFKKTTDNHYQILPFIKKMVTPFYLNLAEDSYPSFLNNTYAIDVIFCQNVMMYFMPELIQKITEKFYMCLVDDGWLIVSPTESIREYYPKFNGIAEEGVNFYKKRNVIAPLETHTRDKVIKPVFKPIIHPDITAKPIPIKTTPINHNPKVAAQKIKDNDKEKDNELVKSTALLAQDYANKGNLQEALNCCEKAIAHNKVDAKLHFLMANILLELTRLDDALIVLKKVLFLEPEFIPAYIEFGNILTQQGKRNEAKKYFNNALVLLTAYKPEEIPPGTDGMTAGRIAEMIRFMENVA